MAVREAMQPLRKSAMLRAERLDDEVATWLGVASVDSVLAVVDLAIAGQTEVIPWIAAECGAIRSRVEFASLPAFVGQSCAQRLYEDDRGSSNPGTQPTDASVGALLASIPWTSVGPPGRRSRTWSHDAARAQATALHARIEGESRPQARALMGATEAALWQSAGNVGHAHKAAMQSIQDDPKGLPSRRRHRRRSSTRRPTRQSRLRLPGGCRGARGGQTFVGRRDGTVDGRLQTLRRAYALAPYGYWTGNLGESLLRAGRIAEAQALAAQSGSEVLRVELEASEARSGLRCRGCTRASGHCPRPTTRVEKPFTLLASVQASPTCSAFGSTWSESSSNAISIPNHRIWMAAFTPSWGLH